MRALRGLLIVAVLLVAAKVAAQEVSLGGGANPDAPAIAISAFDMVGEHREKMVRAPDSWYARVALSIGFLAPGSTIVIAGPSIPGAGAAENRLVYPYPDGARNEQLLSGLVYGEKLTVAVYSPQLASADLAISKVLRQEDPLRPWKSIFGDDDQTPLLQAGRPDLEAVSHSITYLSIVTPSWDLENCSGFVVGPRTIMTNNHCIANQAECDGATIVFDYFVDRFDSTTMGPQVGCEAVLTTDYDLDFTVVRTKTDLPANAVALSLLATAPLADEPAVLVHHPNGQPKTVSIIGCLPIDIAVAGRGNPPSSKDFSHRCDSAGGSSGSPVLVSRVAGGTNGFCVGGLHHWGFENSGDYRDKNRAVMTSAILARTKAENIPILECN
ncbi:serine protease [Devosia sp. LjRoot16]|uniref:trypsin-like serine peptidase n=1 Tax=Devosia sp. LjRoot16 TaxID=3342271 RepID=UPI003ECF840B